MADTAQWFDSLGKCVNCSKAATGKIMSTSNYPLGAYCQRCADKRIRAAKKERSDEAFHAGKPFLRDGSQ